MAAPLLPSAPQTPLKPSTRARSRLRSNTFSLSSPPSYSGRSLFSSSPASVKTHRRGGSSALLVPDGTSAPAQPSPIKTRAASPSSARGHVSRPSIGTPFAPAPRQLNAPRYAPPLPALVPVPLCTPPVLSPSATSTVFGFPFPEQPKLPNNANGNGNGASTSIPPKHQRPPPLRRRSSSSGSFRSALAVEFDNAVRKRDEESASSSFSLQNRQLWADALFLRLCSRPPRAAPSGTAQAFPTPVVVPAPPPTVPAVMSPALVERNTKEMYRKREGSSSLGRFKKPAALSHRSSKTVSVDVTRGVDCVTTSLPLQEGSPKSTRLHRRRPSMPNVPSPSAVKHESCGLTTKSMPVPRLPEWACAERAARKSEETSRSSKEAVVTNCALSRAGTLTDAEADAEWRHLSVSSRAGGLRLAPTSSGQASSVSSGDSPYPPSPLTPSTPSAASAIELSVQTQPNAPSEPSPPEAPADVRGRQRVEQRVSLPERGPRRSRAHTMGASSHSEEVASISKGLSGRSGLLPTLMPVLFPIYLRPGSLKSTTTTIQTEIGHLLPSEGVPHEREQESLLLDVLKAGNAYKSLPPSPTSPLSSTEKGSRSGGDASEGLHTGSRTSYSGAQHGESVWADALRHPSYIEQGDARPSNFHKPKSLPSKHASQGPSPMSQDEALAYRRDSEVGTTRLVLQHRSSATSLVRADARSTRYTSVDACNSPATRCRTSTGKRSTSSREGNSSEEGDADRGGDDDGEGDGDGMARKTARHSLSRSSPRREQSGR